MSTMSVRYVRILDAESKEVEFILEPSGPLAALQLYCDAVQLALLNFTEEERCTFGTWLQEFTETERCVRCIQERLVSGVCDGDEERRERIEAALQNNLCRLKELRGLLQTAKARVVDAWRRRMMEMTTGHKHSVASS
jgi:hypothetical protein